jgi:hypothetical protein
LTSLNDLADIRRILGDFQGARQLFEQTLNGRQRVLGPSHPDTLWSMHSLAVVHRNVGESQDARQLFEQILAARADRPPGAAA